MACRAKNRDNVSSCSVASQHRTYRPLLQRSRRRKSTKPRKLRTSRPEKTLGRRHLPQSSPTPKLRTQGRATFRSVQLSRPKPHLLVQNRLNPDRSFDQAPFSKPPQSQLTQTSSRSPKRKSPPPLHRPLCRPNPSSRPLPHPLHSAPSPFDYPFPVEPGPGAPFHIVLAAFDRLSTFNLASSPQSGVVAVPVEDPALPTSLAAAPLRGCTAVAVVDRASVALAHIWEEPDMHGATPARFRLAVLGRLRRALTRKWGGTGAETRAFVITPRVPWGFGDVKPPLMYAAQVERIREVVKATVPTVKEVEVVEYDPERGVLGIGRQQVGGTQVLLQYAPAYWKNGRRSKVVRLWFERRLLYEDIWEGP